MITLLPEKLELEEQKPRIPRHTHTHTFRSKSTVERQREEGGARKMAPCVKAITP